MGGQRHRLRTGSLQLLRRVRVGAQKNPIAGFRIVDEQRRFQVRQPEFEQIVRDRRVLFQVIRDQMVVAAKELGTTPVVGEQRAAEDLDLQGKIEQVVVQAERAEGIDQFLRCLLYTSDAADDLLCVDLGGRRIIKKKKKTTSTH